MAKQVWNMKLPKRSHWRQRVCEKVQTGCLAEQGEKAEGGREPSHGQRRVLTNAKYAANARSVFEGASKYACIVEESQTPLANFRIALPSAHPVAGAAPAH